MNTGLMQKQNVEVVEKVKSTLKKYSKFLRRDFLAILVKICSKEFAVRTVRNDWRTRTGMFAFLASVWPQFLNSVSKNTVVNWYCHHFDSAEKVFSKRKFVMYLYDNWSNYGPFLSSSDAMIFLVRNQAEIEQYIDGVKEISEEFKGTECGESFAQIISSFKGKLTRSVPIVAAPQKQQPIVETKEEQEISFAPEVDELSSPCIEDIEIQDPLDYMSFDGQWNTGIDAGYDVSFGYTFDTL